MTTTMKQRVATGVATLNALIPNWRERIDIEKFNIANIENCIMGQLGGDYGQVIEELFGDYEPAYICGFSIPFEECRGYLHDDDDGNPWVELQLEWLAVLMEGEGEMLATHVTANHNGSIVTSEAEPIVEIFETTKFFPTPDGKWLAVDFFDLGGSYSWYVIQSK